MLRNQDWPIPKDGTLILRKLKVGSIVYVAYKNSKRRPEGVHNPPDYVWVRDSGYDFYTEAAFLPGWEYLPGDARQQTLDLHKEIVQDFERMNRDGKIMATIIAQIDNDHGRREPEWKDVVKGYYQVTTLAEASYKACAPKPGPDLPNLEKDSHTSARMEGELNEKFANQSANVTSIFAGKVSSEEAAHFAEEMKKYAGQGVILAGQPTAEDWKAVDHADEKRYITVKFDETPNYLPAVLKKHKESFERGIAMEQGTIAELQEQLEGIQTEIAKRQEAIEPKLLVIKQMQQKIIDIGQSEEVTNEYYKLLFPSAS